VRRAYVLLQFYLICFSDSCQTNYLNIYRTELHEICRIDGTFAVDERSEVIFSPSGDFVVATNFADKIDLYPHLEVRMAFARAAAAAARHTTRRAIAMQGQANK